MKSSKLTNSVISWNLRFPVDRWWRMRHNVPFMSPVHRETSFIHQMFEFEEEKLYTFEKKEKDFDKYIPGIGDIFRSGKGVALQDFAKEAQSEIDELLKLENNGRK